MKYKKLIVWVLIILIWFLLTMFQLSSSFAGSIIFPNPIYIIREMNRLNWSYFGESLLVHTGVSFYRMFTAIGLAFITAVPIGLLCGYVKKIEVVVSAIVDFLRPLPPLAYYTVIIVAMKSIDNGPKIMLLFIAAFCPLYIACVMAVKQVKQDYILSAKTLGASEFQIFRNVVLPSSLPNIFTGFRTAASVAFTTLVSAELFSSYTGLGFVIARGYENSNYSMVFFAIIVIGVSALLLDTFLRYVDEKLIFWKGQA